MVKQKEHSKNIQLKKTICISTNLPIIQIFHSQFNVSPNLSLNYLPIFLPYFSLKYSWKVCNSLFHLLAQEAIATKQLPEETFNFNQELPNFLTGLYTFTACNWHCCQCIFFLLCYTPWDHVTGIVVKDIKNSCHEIINILREVFHSASYKRADNARNKTKSNFKVSIKRITIAKFAMLLDFGAYTNYERTL